jgi:hypothetical protein
MRTWPPPSWIGSWNADALSTSMAPRGERVISTWKRSCLETRNGSEFPELTAQNFRNPHHDAFSRILKKDVIATYMQDGKYPYTKPSDIAMISVGALAILLGLLADIFLPIFPVQPRWFVRICLMLFGIAAISEGVWHWI